MKTKTIIRIEYPEDGHGLFNYKCKDRVDVTNEETLSSIWDRHSTYNPTGGFPTPSLDGLDMYKEDKEWFCAFKSLEQVNQWILVKEMKALIKHGFIILLLEVSDYQEGEMQIIYTKESITSSKDISQLFI